MNIQFKKGITKASVLRCIREDGSITWSKLHRGTEAHDIAHYAIETILEFKMAFYGMIQEGYDIQDFELPASEKPLALMPSQMDVSALQTEHMVNLLQIEYVSTGENQNFLSDLGSVLAEKKLSFPAGLDEVKLKEIRTLFAKLLHKWEALAEGESLELTFEV